MATPGASIPTKSGDYREQTACRFLAPSRMDTDTDSKFPDLAGDLPIFGTITQAIWNENIPIFFLILKFFCFFSAQSGRIEVFRRLFYVSTCVLAYIVSMMCIVYITEVLFKLHVFLCIYIYIYIL